MMKMVHYHYWLLEAREDGVGRVYVREDTVYEAQRTCYRKAAETRKPYKVFTCDDDPCPGQPLAIMGVERKERQ